MIIFTYFVWLIFLIYLLVDIKAERGLSKDRNKEISITSNQYCEGCKAFAIEYSNLVSIELNKMRKNKIEEGATLQIDDKFLHHLCDSKVFSEYDSIVKYSCIKILDELPSEFLIHFEGMSTFLGSFTSGTLAKKIYDVIYYIYVLFLIDLFKLQSLLFSLV